MHLAMIACMFIVLCIMMFMLQCLPYKNQLDHTTKNGKKSYYRLQIEAYLRKYGLQTPSSTAWSHFNETDANWTKSTFTNAHSKVRFDIEKGRTKTKGRK